jgi:DNA-binding beta-propeller fold protein YncE
MRYQSFFICLCAVSVLSILLIPGVNADTPQYTFQWVAYGNGNIIQPYGIAVNSSGFVYIADTFNDSIQVLSSGGAYVTEWGTRGIGAGQFYRPHSIAMNSSGYMYVADMEITVSRSLLPVDRTSRNGGTMGTAPGSSMDPLQSR